MKLGVIIQKNEYLKEWVRVILDDVPISFSPPKDSNSSREVSLYLLDLIETPPLRSGWNPPLQFSLRYLVTTWSDAQAEAHRWLGKLVVEAMQEKEMDVELGPASESLWLALGIKPRPFFMIRLLVKIEQGRRTGERVLSPLVVEQRTLAEMAGVVVGPNDIPIAGALVSLPSLNINTRSDKDGRFYFPAVPAGEDTVKLVISAKGFVREFSTETSREGDELKIDFGPIVENNEHDS